MRNKIILFTVIAVFGFIFCLPIFSAQHQRSVPFAETDASYLVRPQSTLVALSTTNAVRLTTNQSLWITGFRAFGFQAFNASTRKATNNAGDVWFGSAASNGDAYLTRKIAAGEGYQISLPPGQAMRLYDWFFRSENTNDAVLIEYEIAYE